MRLTGEVKARERRSRSESESEKGVESVGADAKLCDLRMARLRSGKTGWRAELVSVEKDSDELCVGVKG